MTITLSICFATRAVREAERIPWVTRVAQPSSFLGTKLHYLSIKLPEL